jgi:hypothetical protein
MGQPRLHGLRLTPAIRRIKEAQSATLARGINERCRVLHKAIAIIEGRRAAWITSAAATSPAIWVAPTRT